MVTVYTSTSCSSCRKAIKWLEENNIPYKEINFVNTKIKREDVLNMLENTENGFEDIISTRSKAYQELKEDIETMKVNVLIDFILKNPSILKRPIIIEDNKFQVGYNDEEIRTFIPAEIRKKWTCHVPVCETCEYVEELKEVFHEIND